MNFLGFLIAFRVGYVSAAARMGYATVSSSMLLGTGKPRNIMHKQVMKNDCAILSRAERLLGYKRIFLRKRTKKTVAEPDKA